eukprot:1142153-Pelagomonas_calceolata.AAC.5
MYHGHSPIAGVQAPGLADAVNDACHVQNPSQEYKHQGFVGAKNDACHGHRPWQECKHQGFVVNRCMPWTQPFADECVCK